MNQAGQAVRESVSAFIRENFIFGRKDFELKPDQSLIENGIIDSTGILELVMFLEETYSIQIKDEELIPENLDSINSIVLFLSTKGVGN